MKAIKPIEKNFSEERLRYFVESFNWLNNGNMSVKCSQPLEKVTITVDLKNTENNVTNLEDCSRSCLITAPRKKICTNSDMLVEYNARKTFWFCLVIVVIASKSCFEYPVECI